MTVHGTKHFFQESMTFDQSILRYGSGSTDRQTDGQCSNKCRTSLECQPYIANMFFQKIQSAYKIWCIYSNAFESNFIPEPNTMDHDQTAPKGAV